jgi:hypothetical protein
LIQTRNAENTRLPESEFEFDTLKTYHKFIRRVLSFLVKDHPFGQGKIILYDNIKMGIVRQGKGQKLSVFAIENFTIFPNSE